MFDCVVNFMEVSVQVFTLIRAFLYAYGGICAAMVLHKRLLHSILMAPTVFFDTTPVSYIVCANNNNIVMAHNVLDWKNSKPFLFRYSK